MGIGGQGRSPLERLARSSPTVANTSTIVRIILCTGNPGKMIELRALLPEGIELGSLADGGLPTELPENGDTLEANALEKARFAFGRCGEPCLADDTGLEVDTLNGLPGVLSARYAGEAKDAQANMRKLLRELDGKEPRTARFRTVIAFVGPDDEALFEGTVEGRILEAPRGDGGFGYDPLFVPQGEERTFAEMDAAAKNAISHRARAVEKAVRYLKDRYALR
ncbi:MAG: RdgB/HAM1 family non-canonical purine NTP pyrophosphatase [Flavobacteriales bacterium]|nr:RdgB/HAM1 family non-canonical purine NTP pyrophosphatase [Flavobacteriales bacterium]